MLRVRSLIAKSNALNKCIRAFSTEVELEEQLFLKQPFDPFVVALMNKHKDNIIYSSYVGANRKPMGFQQIKKLEQICEKQKKRIAYERAMEKPFSLALKYTPKKLADENVSAKVSLDQLKTDSKSNSTAVNLNDEQDISRKIIENETKLAIYRELRERRMEMIDEFEEKYPKNWMQDYETFDENEDDLIASTEFGTPDPSVPISKVPCHGCGALLQCADHSLPGYLPSELIRDQSNQMLRNLICQRCHFLKNYNTALQLKVDPSEYIDMISTIKDKNALVILLVDLIDFPCSVWPGIIDIIGSQRPVFIVGNKVDLLPQDSRKYLDHIQACLENGLIDAGFSAANIKHTCLISAETNYGIEDLITNLHELWPSRGDVYLIGCTNVGKSTLFNALLRSDYCKSKASNIIKRATASIWPGTTLRMLKFPILRPSYSRLFERQLRLHSHNRQYRELRKLKKQQVFTGATPQATLMGHLGQTFSPHRDDVKDPFSQGARTEDLYIDENHKDYKDSRWFFDTPGVVQNDQIINLLTAEELLDAIPKKVLWPRIFIMRPGTTLFLAGLGRIDLINGSDRTRLAVFASEKLPILIVNTEQAEKVYWDCLGTELMCVPRGNKERFQSWPHLKRHEEKIVVSNYESEKKSAADIVLSSTGWVSVNIPYTETASFHAWTPNARGIFVRKPALLPFAAYEYRGKRIFQTPTYALRLPTQTRN